MRGQGRRSQKSMLEIIQTVDETILLWIQETVRQGWLNPLVEFYTTLGNGGLLWIVLSLALLCWRPTRKVGGGVSAGAGHWVPVHQCGGEAPDPAATALHGGGGTRPPAHLRGPQLLPLGAHLRRLRRRTGLGGDLFGPVGPGRRGGQRRVHGPVPAVRGGPLPQRRAGGGADRLPGRPGRPDPGAAVGETACTTVGADMIRRKGSQNPALSGKTEPGF